MKLEKNIFVLFLFTLSFNCSFSQEKEVETIKEISEPCECKTIWYENSSFYGKLKEKKPIKRKKKSKKSCLAQHKEFAKYSGQTEEQMPTTYFCGELLKKGK